MELGLQGKVAVITGGSKGIGLAVAKQFLSEGACVAICARTEEALMNAQASLADYGNVYAEVADATNEEDIYRFSENVFRHFGRMDCWVNNVGATVKKQGDEYSAEEINRTSAICFNSVVYGTQAAFRYMRQNGGSIVNVSSLAARCGTAGRSTLYGPLKAAVIGLATTFAAEYAAFGVRVNAVLPGFTSTPAVESTIPESEIDSNANSTLLHRVATPEEIAAPIVFLCSAQASYITAASLEISGGRSVVLNPEYSYINKSGLNKGV